MRVTLFLILIVLVSGADAATYRIAQWPGGIVPYDYYAGATPTQIANAESSMVIIERFANVDFVLRTSEVDYVRFQDSFQNAASVGYLASGQQDIQLFNWTDPNSSSLLSQTIVHELLHTLGLYHEQNRIDRDLYIDIVWANSVWDVINQGGFTVRAEPAGEYGGYDYDSVMGGGQCYTTTCSFCPLNDPVAMLTCRTIVVLPPDEGSQALLGNRDHVSDMDRLMVSFLYPENDWRFADDTYVGIESGTFFEPYATFNSAITATPSGGTLWVQPGTYTETGLYTQALTIKAPLGNVVIGQ